MPMKRRNFLYKYINRYSLTIFDLFMCFMARAIIIDCDNVHINRSVIKSRDC